MCVKSGSFFYFSYWFSICVKFYNTIAKSHIISHHFTEGIFDKDYKNINFMMKIDETSCACRNITMNRERKNKSVSKRAEKKKIQKRYAITAFNWNNLSYFVWYSLFQVFSVLFLLLSFCNCFCWHWKHNDSSYWRFRWNCVIITICVARNLCLQ